MPRSDDCCREDVNTDNYRGILVDKDGRIREDEKDPEKELQEVKV